MLCQPFVWLLLCEGSGWAVQTEAQEKLAHRLGWGGGALLAFRSPVHSELKMEACGFAGWSSIVGSVHRASCHLIHVV